MRREKELADSIYAVFSRAGLEAADEALAFVSSLPEGKIKKIEYERGWDIVFDESEEKDTVIVIDIDGERKKFSFSLISFLVMTGAVESAIQEVAHNAYRMAIEQFGFGKPDSVAANLLAPPSYRAYQTPDFVAQFARERSAEMIGRRWVSGVLVDNPKAEWVITDTTRRQINKLIQDVVSGKLKTTDLRQAIINSDAFSKARAEMIARTELVNANAYGSLLGMYESRAAGLDVLKGWDSTNEACPVCLKNTEAGFIALEKPFPSGDQRPTAHPSCRCVLVSKVIEKGD